MIQPRRGRRLGAFVIALLSAISLAPREATAASCSGQSHDLLLASGTVSPASGSTATVFTFTVEYFDSPGCTPNRIVVVVAGVGESPLSWIAGDLTSGATFGGNLTLPAGTHGYHFEASSGAGVGLRTVKLTAVDPAAVQILAPPPPPPPPKPTPAPTPRPTPPPSQVPPAPTDTPPPATPSTPVESPTGPVESAATSAPPPEASAGAVGGVTGGSPPPEAGAGRAPGSASWSAIFDLNNVPQPMLALAVSSAGTLAGLLLFVLLSARLIGGSPGGGLRLVPLAGRRTRQHDQPVESLPEPTPTSALKAPPADPVWSGSILRAPILFITPPSPGIDRCRIVSRLVPLRSERDEFSWADPERLDVGDEVDVLRQDGPFCFVRTASGSEGWVPGLTLTGASTGAGDPETPRGSDDER